MTDLLLIKFDLTQIITKTYSHFILVSKHFPHYTTLPTTTLNLLIYLHAQTKFDLPEILYYCGNLNQKSYKPCQNQLHISSGCLKCGVKPFKDIIFIIFISHFVFSGSFEGDALKSEVCDLPYLCQRLDQNWSRRCQSSLLLLGL